MTTRSDGPRNVSAVLNALHERERDGTVIVSGVPGGRIHVRRGLVVSIDTPGAPGAESILLRSGRVTDAAWTAVRAVCRDEEGRLADELAARSLLTATEFEVVCAAAVFDAAFALALSSPESWEVAEPVPVPVSGPAFAPRRIAAETTRRLAVLGDLWMPASALAALRVRPAESVPSRLPPRYGTLLGAANERRTPRDLAFALGRGTYAVMLDLARMHALGLLRETPQGTDARPSTAPRSPAHGAETPVPVPAASLPRRTPGAHQLGGAERS
ncbi:helix-turn-helix domain-containing protein [Streptomyces ziwulingensis]|uniref:DUF4388 domain-containing protein n=1 Tax=Streptomyces ziwulingensis TaxID=1045501 RepID=A0ABP9C8E6_9ACTN